MLKANENRSPRFATACAMAAAMLLAGCAADSAGDAENGAGGGALLLPAGPCSMCSILTE